MYFMLLVLKNQGCRTQLFKSYIYLYKFSTTSIYKRPTLEVTNQMAPTSLVDNLRSLY